MRVFLAISFFASLGLATAADRIAKAIFVEPPKDAPEKVFLISADKTGIEIELPSRNLSPDIVLPKGDLVLAVLPRMLSEDEEIPKGAPIIRIPKAWSRTYLVFAFSKANKVFPIEVLPVNGSVSQFPLGHSRIINFTPAMVKGQFGENIITVGPNKVEDMAPPRRDFGAYPVNVDYIMKGDEKPTSLMRSRWQHDPQSRQLLLITMSPTAKYPRIRGIQDKIPVQE